MNRSTPNRPTAVVTGASRGFGRAIAAALVAGGATVVGVARSQPDLDAVQEALGDHFVPVVGDATDFDLANELLGRYRPRVLVMNAGARPVLGSISEMSWPDFGVNWETDTKHVFAWTQAALNLPLAPGSHVVSVGSRASQAGSPLSGGYAGAKATVRFITEYAAGDADRRDLKLQFVRLMPQLTPLTGLGSMGVAAYGEQSGDMDGLLARLEPHLTPGLVGDAIAKLVAPAFQAESTQEKADGQPGTYLLTGNGLRALV